MLRMNRKDVTILSARVEAEFLPFVRRPGRYIGGEVNQIKKDYGDARRTKVVKRVEELSETDLIEKKDVARL